MDNTTELLNQYGGLIQNRLLDQYLMKGQRHQILVPHRGRTTLAQ